ncbi:MAG: thiamine phosphate synthase [Myxococcota bacterium]
MAQGLVTPQLMLILDRQVAGSDAEWLRRLVTLYPLLPDHGRVWLQLRCKQVAGLAQRQLMEQARVLVSGRAVPVVVNGGAAGFSGAHWPQAQIPAVATMESGPRSAAVHDVASAGAAAAAGAHVVLFAPVFSPRSKQAKPKGLPALRYLCARSAVPVLALGGVTPERVRPCIQAGASGVAVLSPVSHPDSDPVGTLAAYLSVLER